MPAGDHDQANHGSVVTTESFDWRQCRSDERKLIGIGLLSVEPAPESATVPDSATVRAPKTGRGLGHRPSAWARARSEIRN
jgi:hypothetical protein